MFFSVILVLEAILKYWLQFFNGYGYLEKCDYSSIKFLNWVGRIHGEIAAASIEKNQLTLVKVSLPPDMTQAEYDAQTMLQKE